jgi:hypothetical protein
MLWKVGYVYGGSGHKNLSTQTEEGEGCLPAEDGSRGGLLLYGRPAGLGRPAWVAACLSPPQLSFNMIISPP